MRKLIQRLEGYQETGPNDSEMRQYNWAMQLLKKHEDEIESMRFKELEVYHSLHEAMKRAQDYTIPNKEYEETVKQARDLVIKVPEYLESAMETIKKTRALLSKNYPKKQG